MMRLLPIIPVFPVFLITQETGNHFPLFSMDDAMGHGPQVEGAYDAKTKQYDCEPIFAKMEHKFVKANFVIANLEATLRGKPYKGYPQLSSPDALAVAYQNSGIDVLVTANNRTCDRDKKGIIRTLDVLDSLKIVRTGTPRGKAASDKHNLLVLFKNGITVGILNYTYGTNDLPVPEPTIMDRINLPQMKEDINQARKRALGKLVIVVRRGIEYQQHQNTQQKAVVKFLSDNGVDIIIGGHPHVLQPMHYTAQTGLHKEQFVVYSLGNFVSNRRKSPSDGGAMVSLTLLKDAHTIRIVDKGYHLVWVNKTKKANGKYLSEILPHKEYEEDNFRDLIEEAKDSMSISINNSRKLFKGNTLVKEKQE